MSFVFPLEQAQCLTLPDFYGKAWGPAVEVLVSLLTCISFICLLAGNLVSALTASFEDLQPRECSQLVPL